MSEAKMKRKRGTRGGKKEEKLDLVESVDAEGARKKTRRSKKGKGAVDTQAEVLDDEIAFAQGSLFSTSHTVSELDQETRNYFVEIEKKLQTLDTDFEDSQDQYLFIENVYREVKGKEILIASDYEGSRILERLFKASFDFQVREFAVALAGRLFASHVCQTILTIASDIVEREVQGFSSVPKSDDGDGPSEPEGLPSMQDIVLLIVDELYQTGSTDSDTALDGTNSTETPAPSVWRELMVHPHASHVLRTLLNLLSGSKLVEAQIRSKKSVAYNMNHKTGALDTTKKNRLVPASFSAKLKTLVESIAFELDDVKSLATHPIANPVLQLLVCLPHYSDSLVKTLFDFKSPQAAEFIKHLIQDKVGSHLMEKLVEHSSADVYRALYKGFFKTRWLELCAHPISNFVVQSVIGHCHKESQFEEILDTLAPHFEELLFGAAARSGIVVKIVETAIQYPQQQKKCVDALLTAFHAVESERRPDLANLVLNLRTWDSFQERIFVHKPHTNGSLILQHVLHYVAEQSRVFSDSILGMDRTQLELWISDPGASRILEALLASPTAPNKTKRALVEIFLGGFAKLSCDKYASHFVDKCWTASNIDLKTQIAQEMANSYQTLYNNFHGKFILRNCGIELFKRRREEWVSHQKGLRKEKKERNSAKPKQRDEIDAVFDKVRK
ncbi:Nucleolar protein 9 [Kappamyces sp. JEL0680]|nr:Nucleolar protein 9 [Kappamyces sp. JEL0680]